MMREGSLGSGGQKVGVVELVFDDDGLRTIERTCHHLGRYTEQAGYGAGGDTVAADREMAERDTRSQDVSTQAVVGSLGGYCIAPPKRNRNAG